MAKVSEIDINIYFRQQGDTSIVSNSMFMSSTPEVLQTARIVNDKDALKRLIDDKSCTYLKAPAGIFTEVTLPVEDIEQNHMKDSLLSVSIGFKRLNDGRFDVHYPLKAPASILMVHKDSLNSFFETQTIYNYTSTFMATLSSNAYSFSNIGNMITLMSKKKAEGIRSNPNWIANHPNWNKVVLVPITASYSTDSYGNSTVSSVVNQMGLSSTRLVGGEGQPIEVKVIFAKFHNK